MDILDSVLAPPAARPWLKTTVYILVLFVVAFLADLVTRRLTNLCTFRAYVAPYLKNHPRVHQGLTQLVRQLQPGPTGLPLEIYCFAATTAWVEYEGIQADIFDHLYAILPEFGLRVLQQPSGADMHKMLTEIKPRPAAQGVDESGFRSRRSSPGSTR